MKKTSMSVVVASLLAVDVWANTLNLAYDADPVSLDPHEQLSGATLQYSHMVFDPLVRWSNERRIEARLAEKWERINDHTVRFYLRKGVSFHSGNAFTSKDVIWTFYRLKRSADFKVIFDPFSEMKAIDEYTFDLISKSSYPLTLNAATYIFPMDSQFYTGRDGSGESKSAIKKRGDSFASQTVSATGPYRVVTREQGIRVVFERFKGYWDKQSRGNVDKIVLTPISVFRTLAAWRESAAMSEGKVIKADSMKVLALLSGDVDFVSPVPPSDLERVRKDKNVQLVEMRGERIITFQLNQNRVEAFKDRRVRQAIVHAIDNEGIVEKVMRGFATVSAQHSPEGYLGYNPNLKPRYDLDKAKRLMKEAGYEKGFTVSMLAPNDRYVNDEEIAQAVASMLLKINIKVNLKTVPRAQYWLKFDKRSADMMMIGWHSDTEDSANFTEFLTACPNPDKGLGQYNSGGYCNKRVDALLAKAQREIDVNKRKKLLQKIEQIQYDDAAFVPLHFQHLTWVARKGVNIEPVVNVMDCLYLGDLVIDQ